MNETNGKKALKDKLLNERFMEEAQYMERKYRQLKSDTHVNPSDEGKTVEDLIRNYLRKFLPLRFGINRGYLTNTDGVVSKEKDLIIYDQINTIVFEGDENYKVIPVEGVYATIEVKSRLNKSIIENAATNIESIKTLRKMGRLNEENILVEVIEIGRPVLNLLFAFESDISLKTACKHIHSHRNLIDAACILTLGNIGYLTLDERDSQGDYQCRFDCKVQKNSTIAYFTHENHLGSTLYWNFSLLLDWLVEQVKKPTNIPIEDYYDIRATGQTTVHYLEEI